MRGLNTLGDTAFFKKQCYYYQRLFDNLRTKSAPYINQTLKRSFHSTREEIKRIFRPSLIARVKMRAGKHHFFYDFS